MNTPDVPYRFELSLEVPGTADQVWQAIATASGISAWMCPTEGEPGPGGTITFDMGPEASSTARITGWEPGRRLEYEEDWASLMGHAGAAVTPLATEFVVETRSGGTCVVRVVSSAFGAGADWEDEFWAEMDTGWAAMLDNLRLYLTFFPGQEVVGVDARIEVGGGVDEAVPTIARALGAERVGQPVSLDGTSGVLERLQHRHLLVRTEAPVPGFVWFFAFPHEGRVMIQFAGHLFGDGAADQAAGERDRWTEWVRSLWPEPAPTTTATANG